MSPDIASVPGWLRVAGDAAGGVAIRPSAREYTNTVLVHHDDRGLLIDPGWDPDELDAIAADLAATRIAVAAGLATHGHYDHVLWHPGFGNVPRYASPAAAALAAAEHEANLDALGAGFRPDVRPDLRALVGLLTPLGGTTIPWSGPRAIVVVHDGHSPGHAAVFVERYRVLVAGDMLSDVEIPLLAETGVAAYAAALDALEPLARRAALVVPGHGHAGDPCQRMAADRAYLTALAAGGGEDDPRIGTDSLRGEHHDNLAAR